MRMLLSLAAAALAFLSSNVAHPQELELNTICIAASKPGIIKSRNASACRKIVKSQSFRVMMNVGEEGRANNQTLVLLANGISFGIICGGGGNGEIGSAWVFASNETTPAVVQIDELPPQELEPFELRPDPSAPDRSFAAFGAGDESGDDRMTIINVPVMSLLADDGTELRITDARTHLNTDEANCTAVGTLTMIRP